ncbi:MAG: sigma-70 family RNA polymerase sigma factor [Planctomycetaceae bacterium]
MKRQVRCAEDRADIIEATFHRVCKTASISSIGLHPKNIIWSAVQQSLSDHFRCNRKSAQFSKSVFDATSEVIATSSTNKEHFRHRGTGQRHNQKSIVKKDIAEVDSIGLQDSIQTALAELPPDKREIIERRYFNHESMDQIAQAFGVNPGTISRRIEKCLEFMAQMPNLKMFM